MIKNFTYLFILFLFSCSSNKSFLPIKNTYENLPEKEINLLKLTSTPTINCRDNINYVDVDDFIFFLVFGSMPLLVIFSKYLVFLKNNGSLIIKIFDINVIETKDIITELSQYFENANQLTTTQFFYQLLTNHDDNFNDVLQYLP